VSNWIRSFSSGKRTARAPVHEWYRSTLENGSAKPPGSTEGYRGDVHFVGGGDMFGSDLFSASPNDHNVATNNGNPNTFLIPLVLAGEIYRDRLEWASSLILQLRVVLFAYT